MPNKEDTPAWGATCPFTDNTNKRLVFYYDDAPPGETRFASLDYSSYDRKVFQFESSKHYVSVYRGNLEEIYESDYGQSTYGDHTKLKARFDRIMALPSDQSDNHGRLQRIASWLDGQGRSLSHSSLLDIGSGLGVFPAGAKGRGAQPTCVEPDVGQLDFLANTLKLPVYASIGDIQETYDLITLNKVLEHIEDPVGVLKEAGALMKAHGFMYIELPDGECAEVAGADREEFFIEHLHVFSWTSFSLLVDAANLELLQMERLIEPSGKFTLRALVRPSTGSETA